jgi:hypothetical protein
MFYSIAIENFTQIVQKKVILKTVNVSNYLVEPYFEAFG